MAKLHLVLPTKSPATFFPCSLGVALPCWSVPAFTLQQTHNRPMFNLSVRAFRGIIETQPGASSPVLIEVVITYYISRAILVLATIGGLMSAYFMLMH